MFSQRRVNFDCWHIWAEVLPSKKLLGRIEGHGKACDKEVGEGETDQEVVVDASQLPVEEHAGDHQHVGEDRHQDDGDQEQSLTHIEEGELKVLLLKSVG